MEAKNPPQPPHSRPRLTREAWLDNALEAIGRRGHGWVGIHDLVEDLGVTKGSFYWHFKNREEFVKALLDHWIDAFTTQVPASVDRQSLCVEDRLLAVMEMVSDEKLNRLDLAIRAWALRERAVAEAVKTVDRFRLDYVGSLFRELGFRGDELEMRTRTFVVYHSLESALTERENKSERKRRLKLRHAMLVRKPAAD